MKNLKSLLIASMLCTLSVTAGFLDTCFNTLYKAELLNNSLETHIILKNCNMERIRTKAVIEDYLIHICPFLGMHPFEIPIIKHRNNHYMTGYSFAFLTDEGLIWGQFINKNNNAHIRILSHKDYKAETIARYSKTHFGAESYSIRYITVDE